LSIENGSRGSAGAIIFAHAFEEYGVGQDFAQEQEQAGHVRHGVAQLRGAREDDVGHAAGHIRGGRGAAAVHFFIFDGVEFFEQGAVSGLRGCGLGRVLPDAGADVPGFEQEHADAANMTNRHSKAQPGYKGIRLCYSLRSYS